MDIYISTLAFLGKDIEDTIAIAADQGYAMEFSSALPHHPKMDAHFLDYPHAKLAHNYFPAPEAPFVINLGSSDEVILMQSIEHCIQGLHLTKKAGAPFFAAHAGFCIDPNPEELGKQLKMSDQWIDKSVHWEIFISSVKQLIEVADELEVDFLIENNVTAKMNLNVHQQNPLLCSDPKELSLLANTIQHPRFGLLLDTAHLKVSAQTLEFNLDQAVEAITPFIKAIHHSDNEGLLDNNQALTPNYWFAKYLTNFSNIPHVIEVKNLDITAINQHLELLNSYLPEEAS